MVEWGDEKKTHRQPELSGFARMLLQRNRRAIQSREGPSSLTAKRRPETGEHKVDASGHNAGFYGPIESIRNSVFRLQSGEENERHKTPPQWMQKCPVAKPSKE